MTKADYLYIAKFCFDRMNESHSSFGRKFWETHMYDALFAWARWRE